jgi:hypothetical protein
LLRISTDQKLSNPVAWIALTHLAEADLVPGGDEVLMRDADADIAGGARSLDAGWVSPASVQ